MVLPKPLRDYNRLYQIERREHPSLPSWVVKRIASDHLRIKKYSR